MLSMSIVLVGLIGRAVIEKVLALQGGAAAVALWGQVGSLVDLLSGVGLAGIGVGVVVLVARERQASRRWGTLGVGVVFGLLLSGLLLGVLELFPRLLVILVGGLLPQELLRLAGLAGWLGIVPGILNNYWQGRQYRLALFAWAVLVMVASMTGILWRSEVPLMGRLLWAQIALAVLVALGLLTHFTRHAHGVGWGDAWRPLLRYAPAGLSIGLLSPISSLIMRRELADALSWEDVGMIQAQWRVVDWVMALASGVMTYHFLPLLSAAMGKEFDGQLGRMARWTLLPSALLMLVYWLFQEPILWLFYQSGFALSPRATALFLLGDWVRILSWIFLYTLYVRRQTWAIVFGEIFSLPLFATLLWLAPAPLAAWHVGALWVVSYCTYATFNGLMVLKWQPVAQS
ncbi:MAG: hypothetical protein HQM02_06980 [Magnetococcales bacterium]|nr:hypothetical protein [Magnetococcales bacterium]